MQHQFTWPSSQSETQGGESLSASLVAALRDVLATATARAAGAYEAPNAAMHDYRRALRRAEALVALTRSALRRFPATWIDASLAHAMRQTSALRDHAALAERAAELEVLIPAFAATEPTASSGLAGLLEARRDAAATGENVAWRLRKNVRALAGLGDIYAAALSKADAETLLTGVRALYREARRTWKAARRSRLDRDVHAWRRALRLLRNALELLMARGASGGPGDAGDAAGALAAAHVAAQGVVKTLGLATDLMALGEAVAGFEDEEAPGLADVRVALGTAIFELQVAEIQKALEAAAAFFEPKPKAFLAPPAVEGEALASESEGAPAEGTPVAPAREAAAPRTED